MASLERGGRDRSITYSDRVLSDEWHSVRNSSRFFTPSRAAVTTRATVTGATYVQHARRDSHLLPRTS